jgi:hypothetical protein
MKKLHLLAMAMLVIIGFTACSSNNSDDDGGGGNGGTNSVVGIKNLSSSLLGDWDEGFATSKGVFLLKDYGSDAEAKGRKAEGSGETLLTKTLFFTSVDGKTKAALLVSKETNRPIQLIMNDGILYFSFLNDNVLELVFKRGSDITYVDQIEYNKSSLDAALALAAYTNNLQKALFYFAKVMDSKKISGYPTLVAATNFFKDVLNMTFDGTSEATAEEAGVSESIAKEADSFESSYAKKIYSTVTVWTGKASFKVGGSSCTLSGSVFCSNPAFEDAGEFGIVCDKDQSKLFVGQAEFEGKGELTDDFNFDVDFRGLSATTTYYYRAYYKFSDGSTTYGSLTLDPAEKADDNVAYDKVVKNFTTDENRLTVEVVMCMDISGSMSSEISMVKNNALSFYDQFKEMCDAQGIDLEGLYSQVITYSDINVDAERALSVSDTYNLTKEEQREAFKAYVDDIYLAGGGDIPESGLEALMAAFKHDWGVDDGYHRQVVILWTDAPYKTINDNIYKKEVSEGVYEEMFTASTYEEVKAMWDSMPSGRRMIIFGPYGNSYSNGGEWDLMDDWKNVVHERNNYDNLSNFAKSLEYIISELTSKETRTTPTRSYEIPTFRPNE